MNGDNEHKSVEEKSSERNNVRQTTQPVISAERKRDGLGNAPGPPAEFIDGCAPSTMRCGFHPQRIRRTSL